MSLAECTWCGQLAACERETEDPGHDGAPIVFWTCAVCAERDRAPQGETVRLFNPAPAQLAGQTHLEV